MCCGKSLWGEKIKVTLHAKLTEVICMKRALFLLHVVRLIHSFSNFVTACVAGDYGQAFWEAVPMVLHVLQIAKQWPR